MTGGQLGVVGGVRIADGGDAALFLSQLGVLSSGVLQIAVSGGVATPSTFVATAKRIPFGSGTNGGLTDAANGPMYDSALTALSVGAAAPTGARFEIVTTTDTTNGAPSAFDTKFVTVGQGGATSGNLMLSYRISTSTAYIAAIQPGTAYQNLKIQFGGGTLQLGSVGTTIGVFGATPAAQQVSGANVTNNVTAGGVNDTIADFTSLTVYATDAAAIRNDIYQLARKVKQINDGLRTLGFFT